MDLEALGAPRLGARIVAPTGARAAIPATTRCSPGSACFRALVRAKVAAVRAAQPGADADGAVA